MSLSSKSMSQGLLIMFSTDIPFKWILDKETFVLIVILSSKKNLDKLKSFD